MGTFDIVKVVSLIRQGERDKVDKNQIFFILSFFLIFLTYFGWLDHTISIYHLLVG